MSAARKPEWAPVKYTSTQLGGGVSGQGQPFPGGLDLTTPSLRLQPGALRDALNFEVAQFGGYSRVEGYERIDGRASPSGAVYRIVQCGGFSSDFTTDFTPGDFGTSTFLTIPTVGQVVTQAVSGATGTIIAVVTAPIPYIVVTEVTGVFDQSHPLTTPGVFAMAFDPATLGANAALSGGNLTITSTGASQTGAYANASLSSGGKYYFEFTIGGSLTSAGDGDTTCVGFGQQDYLYFGHTASFGHCLAIRTLGNDGYDRGDVFIGPSGSVINMSTGRLSSNLTLGFAVDLVNNRTWIKFLDSSLEAVPIPGWNIYEDGINVSTADPSVPATGYDISGLVGGPLFPFAGLTQSGYVVTANFGESAFVGTPPVGFAPPATGAIGTAPALAIGTATALTISIDAKTTAIYTAAAASVYRAPILKVPGGGPVLGVVAMAFLGVDQLYAFRGNAGGTAALLYRASPAGWVLVPYFNLVSFTAGGTVEPFDGETLTQGGVTATIQRVMWQSGSWAATAGSAVGQFVVTNPAGGNFTAGAAHTTSGATLTLAGAQTPITMAAGGRFEFEKCNFSGQPTTRRIYGCDGVNPPFEFDGVTLAPISTGGSPNAPSHIRFHKNFLFLAQSGSLIYCAAATPFKWDSVDGGGEIATGDTITGMITLPGSQTTATLGVYLRSNAAFLYGTDPTTFNLVTFSSGIGAVPYSVQNLFDTFFLDDLGVVTLKTTLNWGNFLPSTLTKNILPFIARERGNLVASAVNRSKSQYRLFFGDGYALYCTILNQQYIGSAPVLFPDLFTSIDTTKLITDTEATYAGGASGYVYQLDVGTSFDGAAISAYFVTAWDAVKSPRILKRFRAASIEVQGDSYAEIQYGYQLGYNSDQIAQLPAVDAAINLGSAPHWDSFVWDNFVWDGTGLEPTDVDETGTAENVRVTITSGTNYIGTYTVNSIIHHYSMRRGMRV